MSGSKPGERRGGRQKGTPNRVTAEIKAAFQKHGDELVEALLALTKDKDPRVRLGAIQAALDRGWGKATQQIEAELSVYDSLSLAEKQALLEVIDALDVDEEGNSDGPALTHH